MSQCILCVDDDNSIRESLTIYLSEKGFIVESFDNVDEAFKNINNNIPDLIIADIVMPQKSGYQLLDMVQTNAQYYKIPFIFLTAKGMTQDRIKGYDAGCSAYLTKPFDPNELLSIIKNLLLRSHNQISMNNNVNNDLNIFFSSFTAREQQILQLVLMGKTNKEIADILKLGKRNIEKYVSRLLEKTCTRNRTELVKYYFTWKSTFVKGE